MTLKMYFDGLTPTEHDAYAVRYGNGFDYVKKFLLGKRERRRMPNTRTLRRIIAASEGELNWAIVLAWFYPELEMDLKISVPMPPPIVPETETNRIGQSLTESASGHSCGTGDQSQLARSKYGL